MIVCGSSSVCREKKIERGGEVCPQFKLKRNGKIGDRPRLGNKFFPELWRNDVSIVTEVLKVPKLETRANKILIGMKTFSTRQGHTSFYSQKGTDLGFLELF